MSDARIENFPRMAAATTVEKPLYATWRPKYNPWIVALTVTLATFMEVLDTSIANVALPHIAGGLWATPDEATWVLTSYLVSNAIILPSAAGFRPHGPQALLYGLRGAVYREFDAVRAGSETCHADSLSGDAGPGRRRTCSPVSRQFWPIRFPRAAQYGFAIYGMAMCGAGDRADAGRMDYRQLQLALDLLYQCARSALFPCI